MTATRAPDRRWSTALLAALALWACDAGSRAPLAVGAAASLRPALEAVLDAAGGERPAVVYGATAQLMAQVEQGAGFDLYLGADRAHAERLAARGQGSVFEFARGRLALWVRADSPLHPERDGLLALRDPRVRKVAIASPALAPYGAAAQAVLARAGLAETLAGRLVFGENVAQALHFAAAGGADAALVAASLLPAAGGRHALVDAGLHEPLPHCGVVLARAPDRRAAAEALCAFLRGPRGRELLAEHGLLAPE